MLEAAIIVITAVTEAVEMVPLGQETATLEWLEFLELMIP